MSSSPEAENRQAAALESLARSVRAALLISAFLAVVWVLGDILLLIFASVLLAALLRGASRAVGRLLGVRLGWALAVVLVAILIVSAAFGWWQGSHLGTGFTHVFEDLQGQWRALEALIKQNAWGAAALEDAHRYVTNSERAIAGTLTGFAGTTLGAIGSLVGVIAVAVFLAMSPSTYLKGVIAVLPACPRAQAEPTLDALGRTLRWWCIGQLIDMTIVGVLSWIGLMLLGMPLAATLATLAALANFVPYIGALTGAIPAVLVAFSQGPYEALYVATLFFAIQMIDGNVFVPLIQRQTVSLPPALTILAQIVFGSLFGWLGLLLAPPMAAAGLVVAKAILGPKTRSSSCSVPAKREQENAD